MLKTQKSAFLHPGKTSAIWPMNFAADLRDPCLQRKWGQRVMGNHLRSESITESSLLLALIVDRQDPGSADPAL